MNAKERLALVTEVVLSPITTSVRSRPLSTVQPQRIRWLIKPTIPLRTLTLIAGEGGLGKSLLLAWVTAQLTRGDLSDYGPSDVLLISAEDMAEDVIVPRLIAAGADRDRVHEVYVPTEDGGVIALDEHIEAIATLAADKQARMIWIDPIAAHLGEKIDSHKDSEVRRVLGRLANVAREQDLACAMVAHLNKSPSKDAYIRVNGSVAFYNASRSVLSVTREDGNEDSGRLVAQHKMNIARLGPVLRFRVDEVMLAELDPIDGRPIDTARMVPDGQRDDLTAAEVLGAGSDHGDREPSDIDRAVELLEYMLVDGPVAKTELVKRADAQDISEKTLDRAATRLDVKRERSGFPAVAWWSL